MPLNTNSKLPRSPLSKLSIALTLALSLPLAAHAASLGKLTVLSSLGQPLRAEIELTSVTPQEVGKLAASLAPPEAFNRAKVDFNPVLSSLSFAVEQRQGRHFVRISSPQPMNELFVDLLVELSGSGSNKLVREYTFLLDPPDSRAPRAAQVAPVAPAAQTAPAAPAVPPSQAAAPSVPSLRAAVTPPAPAAPAPTAPAAATPAPASVPATAAAPARPTGSSSASDDEPVESIVQKDAPSPLAEELIRSQNYRAQNEAAQPAAPAAPVAPAPSQTAQGSIAQPAASAPAAPVAANNAAPATAAAAGGKSYTVKPGDTLAGIAARNKNASVSLDQMLIALYRANPDAFMGDNINRLRAGKILAVPDQAAASAIDQGDARGIVVAQAQDFNAYRNKLASQVANNAARKPAGEAKQSGGGKITAKVEEKSSTGDAKDKLELSKAGATEKGGKAGSASAEDKLASDRALADANDRVKELEKNVSDLQKLLEMKNKAMADLSDQQKAAEAAQADQAAKAAAAAAAAPATPATAAAEAKPAEPAAEVKPEAPPAAVPTPAPAPAAAPAAEKPTPGLDKALPKPGFFDGLLQNPYTLPGAGAIVALLAALGVMQVRRRKKGEEEAKKKPSDAAPVAAATAAAAVAAAETEEEAKPAEAPVESQVDPLAEADMYIAYGRDEQAEDILKLALQTQPERHAIRSKLLEIYAKRQDVDNFNKIATDLHAATGGKGEDWEKAVILGAVLDPTNPLYGGSAEAEKLEAEVPAAAPVTPVAPVAPVAEVEPVPVPPPAPPAAPVPEPEPEEDGLDFDLNDFKAAEAAAAATPPLSLGDKIDFDLDLDSDAGTDDSPLVPTPSASPLMDTKDEAPPVSLNDISLDLPGEESAPAPSASSLLEEDEESAFEAEMTTKLDLAAAYQEIGDKEGARELLEEVTRGGNDAQVARAKDMLSKLS
ncbi:LysM peptidoglycan-binding domain-containing protein [Herbaspirillum lusitanum]|uniref:LysM peptidoglycan-binding domain-containing protein n=1 Tax=Herbaspirillum lusitanum TaxID=213312 RepID=A0ABW9ABF8_9BURK